MKAIKSMGSGIVASVPADAPLDAVYYLDFLRQEAKTESLEKIRQDLSKKEIPEVMEINGKTCLAYEMVKDQKLKPKNKSLIKELTKNLYKRYHHEGKMVVDQKIDGLKASEYYKNKLIESQNAMIYYEPEKEVISRSGDKCVVSLTNQWFIKYGNEVVKERVRKHLDKMVF
jgi:leucyl-tRNA synthetase